MTRVTTALTRHAGVIGAPVRHSLSPTLHNAAYEALGLDLVYGAYEVQPGDAAVALAGAVALGFVGISVTTPHKDAIARASDGRTRRVELLGAANSVAITDGKSLADSTDGQGLLDDLARSFGFQSSGARCAVLGAGGAARDVVLSFADAGAEEVVVVNRSAPKAAAAAELAGDRGRVGSLGELGEFDVVINATSVGLIRDPGADEVAHAFAGNLREGQLVVDLVYRPSRTLFLELALASGARIRNGLGMLVHQAARQVEFFTGLEAPIEVMWASVEQEATS
jgi:shikimate dehydrogenase